MNKRGHVVNAILLSVGLGFLMEPADGAAATVAVLEVGLPVTLGALFPDVDTAFGTHRKTFHNLLTFGSIAAFPLVFGNLRYVWIGVLSHYVLDVVGNERGMALLYPWTREFGFPTGVATSSEYSDLVTMLVTLIEFGVAGVILFRVDRIAVEALRSALA